MAQTDQHLVVDGSNVATEGRSLPSLSQLDEAVRAISAEYDYASLTVIVDATFAHRIDESERDEFEAAMLAGELVSPPAGAIGRGDAFILQVASKAKAVVFSNDSFQEFHGEHDWLFDEGRLIGGKPIEGIGWIFVERAPVRGPTSRRAVREAGERSSSRSTKAKAKPRKASGSPKRAAGPPPKPTKANPPPAARPSTARQPGARQSAARQPGVRQSAARQPAARQNVGEQPNTVPATTKRNVEELNDPRTFMGFVSSYSISDEVEAVVEQFSSHGCYLRAASARCYLPSRAMGDPPPTRARDVVTQGQTIIVKVESLDSDRRGINVSLVRVIGDTEQQDKTEQVQDSEATRTRRRNPANNPHESDVVADDSDRESNPTRRTTNVATTKTAKKATARPAAKKATARRAPAAKKAAKPAASKTAATATSSARVQRATAKKTTAKPAAKKAAARKATARKAPAKKTTARKAPAKKTTAARPAAKKAAVKKTTVKKTTVKKTAVKKTTARKAPAKKVVAKKATADKAPAKKATARKAPAKKATARRPAAK